MLPDLLRGQAAQAAGSGSFGKAKSCILLFMWGGPSHLDTFDLKPDAPAEIRGEFKPIETNVPGIRISEHFPLLAKHADKYSIIRSVTHNDNAHTSSTHAMLTGYPNPRPNSENTLPPSDQFPHYGAVLSKLRPTSKRLPSFVALPWRITTNIGVPASGQGGGFLGSAYDPFIFEVKFKWLQQDNREYENLDFRTSDLAPPEGVSFARLQSRRKLLEEVAQGLRSLEKTAALQSHDAFYERAFDLLSSPEAQQAFDISREPDALRDRYGRHIFGQGLLLARRLVEAGVRLVTVYWHLDGPFDGPAWDTHVKNFSNLKARLMPPTDKAFSALLEDLSARGLLDETLVVWMGEFGRTPKINDRGGRDHWGACQSVVMAGGGIEGGQVYGASDEQGGYPADQPVSPADLSATIYHCLGIHPDTEIYDRLGRPNPVSRGEVIEALLAD